MARLMPFLVATALTLTCGVIHGLRSDRWSVSHELTDAVAQVQNVPLEFGDWVGHDTPLDSRELTAGGILGHISRRYENRRDGTAVGVLIVCGRPGPISVHTPDICYAGAGYEIAGKPERLSVSYGEPPQSADLFWSDFRKPESAVPTTLRIFWAWSSGGRPWSAPENPRLAHASYRALDKLYVTHETLGDAGPPEKDPTLAFVRDFLAVADRALAPASASSH